MRRRKGLVIEIIFKQRISMALAEVDVIDDLGKQTLMCISKHDPRGCSARSCTSVAHLPSEVNCHHSR